MVKAAHVATEDPQLDPIEVVSFFSFCGLIGNVGSYYTEVK